MAGGRVLLACLYVGFNQVIWGFDLIVEKWRLVAWLAQSLWRTGAIWSCRGLLLRQKWIFYSSATLFWKGKQTFCHLTSKHTPLTHNIVPLAAAFNKLGLQKIPLKRVREKRQIWIHVYFSSFSHIYKCIMNTKQNNSAAVNTIKTEG